MSDDPIVNEPTEETPTIWAALDGWAKSLSPWQQYIVGHATNQGKLSKAEIDFAYAHFLKTNKLSPKQGDEPDTEIPVISGRPTEPLSANLLLTRVDGLAGINALADGALLTFSSGLTAIYGRNGAGKSGFARLLANACFSRQKPQIISNIYADGVQPSPSAQFHITVGDVEHDPIGFPTLDEPSPLKRITVFDTAVARHHITQPTAFEFKPTGFDVFPEMVRVYGILNEKLDAEIAKRTCENEFPQSFLGGGTEVHAAISTLGPTTDISGLRSLAQYGDAESSRITELETQILALKTLSLKEVLEAQKVAQNDINLLRAQLAKLALEFNESAIEARAVLIQATSDAVAVASALGSDQFKQPFFNAIGTPEWEQFAASTHALARREKLEYATTDDHCLLCERPLDAHSREHINALLAFVEGDVRKKAADAQQILRTEAARLRALELNIFSLASRVRTHVHRLAPDVEVAIEAAIAALVVGRDTSLIELDQLTAASKAPTMGDAEERLTALSEQVAADILRLESADTETVIVSLEQERKLLRHRHVLSQLLPKIEQYVTDAAWVASAVVAKNSLGTRHVTEKEKELFVRIVGDGYRNRLIAECEQLDCDVPIELQTVGRSGQTVRSLALKGGHKPESILSEGEQKVVALADFLTEVALNPAAASVVFDDPVTSQDHQRKKRIALRLVVEAKTRQVIIFTHDLVFLDQLFEAAKVNECEIEGHWVDRTAEGQPGHVSLGDSPLTSKNYENANRAKQALADAKAFTGNLREDAIRKGMGALRTTLEETVVKKLFKDAVQRWSDQVRVTTLRKINWDNAKVEEICALYEDLSRFIEGHSHTDEATGEPAQIADLENRVGQVEALIRWAKSERQK